MIGVPVIINHKDITTDNVKDERVGVVSNVWFNDKDGWYWCDGVIWDETAQNLITEQGWSVSCSYDVLLADDAGGTENNIHYDIEFLDGVFTHLAIVDNPRYERANIVFNSKTVINSQFREEDHPRDEKGKFTSGGNKKSFKDQIKDVELGKLSNKTLLNVLEKPPQVWKNSGLPDKPVVMSAGVYKKATESKHRVDKETIEKLPELIQDPLYIFKSSTQAGSFVGVLNAVENKEKADGPLIVAIKPSQQGLEVNIITSTYGKDNGFIHRELDKGNLLYKNKKTGVSNRKASIALKVNNLSINSITDKQEDFNPDIKNNVENNKEQDMTLLYELKKLITKVENSKGEDMDDENKIENEKVDKRKLIDEVAGIMKSAGADDEQIRTAIGKMEKLGYDKSKAGTADNEKEYESKDDKADNKKVKNEETEEDKKEYKELKEDVKKDVENKCKNSVENSKPNYFEHMNKIYNSAMEAPKELKTYVSQAERLEAGNKY